MANMQPDLFGPGPTDAAEVSEEVVAIIRSRLHATLALVKSSTTMPWSDPLAIVREDNAFRVGKDALPAEEGAALWAEFDLEMDRLYAVMNAAAASIE